MDLYVASNGDDKWWSGRVSKPKKDKSDGPLKTLQGVLNRIAQLTHGQTYQPDFPPIYGTPVEPITVHIQGGTYCLKKPLVFRPEHSWPVTFKPFRNEKVVISGGERITGWRKGSINGKPAWVTDLPEVASGKWEFRELFVNNRRAQRPRLPAKGTFRMKEVPGAVLPAQWDGGHFDKFVCSPGDVREYKNICDIETVYMHYWIEERSKIKAFDPETNTVTMERPSAATPVGTYGSQLADYYLDNVQEALTAPGQWYLDRTAGTLYYLPRKGEKMETAEVIAPRCLQLVGVIGQPEENRFVEQIRFEGITFSHTDWRHPDPSDGATMLMSEKIRTQRRHRGIYAAAGQGACDVPGVIYFEGARHCSLANCTIEHVGWYGVEISDGCHGIRVTGSTLRHLSAGGIKINGAGARDPLVRVRQTGHHTIADNTIAHGGRVFHSAIGVLSMNAFSISIRHNHIYDFFYSAISCGWEWGYQESITRDNLIEFNHIHHLGQKVLSDMGGVYTLGVQPGTVIRNNLIYNITSAHYGGWCIYPDEGSSHILIENNICYDADRQPFHQHYGKENVVRNNIFVFGGEAGALYSRNETHEGLIWIRNIMVSKGEPIFKSLLIPEKEAPRMMADCNLYYNTQGKVHFLMKGKKYSFKQWQTLGRDQHSMVANPKFKNIEKRDFTLAKDSPAFKLGFKPIDLTGIGPRPPKKREM